MHRLTDFDKIVTESPAANAPSDLIKKMGLRVKNGRGPGGQIGVKVHIWPNMVMSYIKSKVSTRR